MKTRNKWILLIVFGLAIVIIAGFVFWPNGYVARWARRQFLVHTKKEVNDAHRHAHLRRVILLCDTDHQTLLKAGREILSQVSKNSLNPRHDEIRHLGDLKFILPKEVQIPHTIQELKPYICLISYDGYLTLEMHGG